MEFVWSSHVQHSETCVHVRYDSTWLQHGGRGDKPKLNGIVNNYLRRNEKVCILAYRVVVNQRWKQQSGEGKRVKDRNLVQSNRNAKHSPSTSWHLRLCPEQSPSLLSPKNLSSMLCRIDSDVCVTTCGCTS